MVRFEAPPLARLVTLALSARLPWDGVRLDAARGGGRRAAPGEPFSVARGLAGYPTAARGAAQPDVLEPSDRDPRKPIYFVEDLEEVSRQVAAELDRDLGEQIAATTAGRKPRKGKRERLIERVSRIRKEMRKYASARGVRTAEGERVAPEAALEKLKEGNERFVAGTAEIVSAFRRRQRRAPVAKGQSPMASILGGFGYAHPSAPLELLFDRMPGELFVLRDAGATLSNATGSVLGSLEYSMNDLGVQLVVVMGQVGAVEADLDGLEPSEARPDRFLRASPAPEQAQLDVDGAGSAEETANAAVASTVFADIEKMLIKSRSIREKVRNGEAQVHGALHDVETGKVTFLGEHPSLAVIVGVRSAD